MKLAWLAVAAGCAAWAQNSPLITLVANAEGDVPVIAPNMWVEVKGQGLSKIGDSRMWQASDFAGNQLPTQLDGVSVTLNGVNAYIYYISPTQVNILTPPNLQPGSATVQVINNGAPSLPFTVSVQPLSPSFFIYNGGPYVIGTHLNGSLLGPPGLIAGITTPAMPGEEVVLYANGFGLIPQSPVTPGSLTQSGTLSPLPAVTIGGVEATVLFAGLVSPGLFQFNVIVPQNTPSGDNPVAVSYNGASVAPVPLLNVEGSTPPPSSITLYVAPNGSDTWSGRIPAPNATNSDGPFATLHRARTYLQSINRAGLIQINVQFRGGTYFLQNTEIFSATDSGSSSLAIIYQNYPGESPVFSGGVPVQNWTNTGGNTWKTALPLATQYFENLYYNGTRRLRPRLGGSLLGAYYRIANPVYLDSGAPPSPAPDPNCSVYVAGSGWECFDRFQYNTGDPITNSWRNLVPPTGNHCGQPAGNAALVGDVELLVFEQFNTSKLRISCVDTVNQIVYLTGTTSVSQTNPGQVGFIAGNRYLVENVSSELNQPGQWFLDRSTSPWTLTYLANTGENPNNDTVIIPQLPQLLATSNLQYVTFQGLTFQHDNYTLPAAGHKSTELEPDISAAVSFQNSQYITFDSGMVTQIAGTGLEFISCLNGSSPSYCVANNPGAINTNNVIQNSAFYDIGALAIRIGEPFNAADTDANEPQFITVQNNVAEGYGRVIPASFGIGQGAGHDNLYTHNDVYDGYHCAISVSPGAGATSKPSGVGMANHVISFNHVYNLLQGIMNDEGSVRISAGNQVFTAQGNQILNNRIHDVTDASIMDSNGYGGNGIHLDNQTGLVSVENNLVYRVSASAVYTPLGPAVPNEADTIKNNILAYARQSLVAVNFPYSGGTPSQAVEVFTISNNLFYFDRSSNLTPPFFVQGGCLYPAGFAYSQFQAWSSNMYWRIDGQFSNDPKAFAVQQSPGIGPDAPCTANMSLWTFYSFEQWQNVAGEDGQSLVQNPKFANPTYPSDDYSLPGGTPGIGFVVFDATQAGRSSPVINPPPVAATFVTKSFNPLTDY